MGGTVFQINLQQLVLKHSVGGSIALISHSVEKPSILHYFTIFFLAGRLKISHVKTKVTDQLQASHQAYCI